MNLVDLKKYVNLCNIRVGQCYKHLETVIEIIMHRHFDTPKMSVMSTFNQCIK